MHRKSPPVRGAVHIVGAVIGVCRADARRCSDSVLVAKHCADATRHPSAKVLRMISTAKCQIPNDMGQHGL
jgi:hypothetical protein